jgi:hypothetical protein
VASSQPVPTATWNTARGVWERPDVNMICGHQALFWETWPTSGMTRSGRLFPLRTWARRTHAPESSSLLPTPQAIDGHPKRSVSEGAAQRRMDKGKQAGLPELVALHLLPTPNAGNFNDGEDLDSWEARKQANLERYGNGNGMGTPLSMAVKMLPTPTSSDRKGASAPVGRSRPDGREYTMGDSRLADVADLLPTPRVGGSNRNSRSALTGENHEKHGRTARGSASGLGLEQALELARGETPRELLPTPTASLQEPAPWKEGVDWWLQSRATRNLEGVVTGNTPLMPTPQAADAWVEGAEISPEAAELQLRRNDPDGSKRNTSGSLAKDLLIHRKLPTPQSRDWKGAPGAGSRERGGHQGDLSSALELLPTPDASMASGGRRSKEFGGTRESGSKKSIQLTDAIHHKTSTGDSMSPPSAGGKPRRRDQLPGQLSLDDLE